MQKRIFRSKSTIYHLPPTNSGFSLVELIIVIAIIAIIATIGLASYNVEIQNSTSSSLQSGLKNASKQLVVDQIRSSTGVYPDTLAAANSGAGISFSSGTTVAYNVDNTDTPKTFCLSATQRGQSYFITQEGTPLAGPCPVLYLDAGIATSYPGTGNTWTDLSGNGNNGTLVNGVGYSSANGGSLTFDGMDDYVSSTQSQNYVDIIIVIKPDLSNSSGLAGIIASGTNTDKSLRFEGVDGVGPWTVASRNPGDANDWAYSSGTTYYVNGNVSNVLVSGWNIFGGYRTNQTTFPSSFAYHLGTSGYAGRYFKGNIAAVLMYNRALTVSEITQIFNALRGRFDI